MGKNLAWFYYRIQNVGGDNSWLTLPATRCLIKVLEQ